MSNPAVVTLASLQECIPSFPYRFEIEDNVGEAIHIHFRDVRLDLTVREFLRLADAAGDMINSLASVRNFRLEMFDPLLLVGLAGELLHADSIVEDEISLEDIIVDTEDENGMPCYAALPNSRVVRALQGDTEQNDRHPQVNSFKLNSVKRYTNAERLQHNLNMVKECGYPCGEERILLEGNSNIILDGQHRAACLYVMKGNITVPVRRLRRNPTANCLHRTTIETVVSLYYRKPSESYSEANRLTATARDLRDGYTFSVAPETSNVRFDPGEGRNCVVSDLQIMLDGEQLIPQGTNGICCSGRYYFFTDDPQIEIPVFRNHSSQILIRAKIGPLTFDAQKSLEEQIELSLSEAELLSARIVEVSGQLEETMDRLKDTESRLEEIEGQWEETKGRLEEIEGQWEETKGQLEETKGRLEETEGQWEETRDQLEKTEAARARTQAELDALNVHYDNICRSVSFRIGRVLTWAPRKLRAFFRCKFIMHNYFDDLDNRIDVCASHFPGSPRKTALRMIWWNFKSLFKCHILCQPEAVQGDDLGLSDKCLNVAFYFRGGLGDHLIDANYVYCFQKKFRCPEMQVDAYCGLNSAVAVFEPGVTCDRVFSERGGPDRSYDLCIELARFPQIIKAKKEKIKQVCPELLSYLEMCEEFYCDNQEVFDDQPFRDGELAKAGEQAGITRLEHPDIGGVLGVKKHFSMPVFIHGDENSYLSSVGLAGKSFITLHRGADTHFSGDVVKLWPQESYNALIYLLKKEYPRYHLVQLGVNESRCPPMDGIDVNLVGKTSMEEVKILLQNAVLHIDCEGGFVHLREALRGGPSAVLFGPTNMAYFGYADNINIRGDGCDESCEWKTRDWATRCVRGFKVPLCMRSITPEMVMERLRVVL